MAANRGLGILSITDHDTVAHLQPAREQSAETGITFIPGVEFSTSLSDRDVHILGYAFDDENPGLLKYLEKVRLRRIDRAHRILELLRRKGVVIPAEEIDSIHETRIIGRPLVAGLMVKYKYVNTLEEAFFRYLRPGTPAYVPYKLAPPQEVIELIQDWGGISVLAHPSLKDFGTLAPDLSQAGLVGVEVFRPQLGDFESREITDKALRMGLILTGGSDWHFNNGPFKFGDFFIEEDRIRPFLELVKQRQ